MSYTVFYSSKDKGVGTNGFNQDAYFYLHNDERDTFRKVRGDYLNSLIIEDGYDIFTNLDEKSTKIPLPNGALVSNNFAYYRQADIVLIAWDGKVYKARHMDNPLYGYIIDGKFLLEFESGILESTEDWRCLGEYTGDASTSFLTYKEAVL